MRSSVEKAIVFPCEGEQLIGILHQPAAGPLHPLGVLIVVGGPQYRVGSHRQFLLMARCIGSAGYPALRFDYRGMGDATGGQRTFEDIGEDIDAAIGAFRAEHPQLRGVVLLGLCDAATAALLYCHRNRHLAGLVLMNPWVRTEEGAARAIVRHYYVRRFLQRSFWQKVVSRELDPVAAAREALNLVREGWRSRAEVSSQRSSSFLERMARGAVGFKGPVLLLLSERDLTAREFEDLCARSPLWAKWSSSAGIRRIRLQDADHTLSARTSLETACAHIVQWLNEISEYALADHERTT